MKKIIISGGSGYLGQLLANHYSKNNCQVVILSRSHKADRKNISFIKWDGKTLGYWVDELENADVLINLNGKSVDCRYNNYNKQLIYDTRIDSTFILGEAINMIQNPPEVWINASSATIYRHSEDKEMDEFTGEIGEGFSVDVCKKWEKVFFRSIEKPVRRIALRTAIVIGKKGGAFQPLKLLTRAGLGGQQGSGNQYFSWLHEDDFISIIDFLIKDNRLNGVFNAASPEPVTNKQLMQKIRKAYKKPFGLPLPEWLLTIGAVLINTEPELVLKSRRVVPGRLSKEGYKFKYPTVQNALAEITK